MNSLDSLTLLGDSKATEPTELLESFPRPDHVFTVTMTSDEVTALCPKTGQPDQYTVKIFYRPDKACIESKSLKLKLQSYRNKGLFVEQLAAELVQHVYESVQPFIASVTVVQKSRGGVSIEVSSDLIRPSDWWVS